MKIHTEVLSDVDRYIENNTGIPLKQKEPQFENMLAYLRPFRDVTPSLKMLEVGTGTGWFPLLCQMRGLNCKGLEISPQLVEFAKEYGRRYGLEPNIELGNLEDTDLGQNVYDVIICSSVFEHVEDWRKGLRKVHRALKPGGLLFFESTNKWSIPSGEFNMPMYGWLPNWARYKLRSIVHGPDIMKLGIDFHQFTYAGLRREFRKIGFSGIHDRVAIADPERVSTPLKRRVLTICKTNALVRTLVLTFFEGTTFVCVK